MRFFLLDAHENERAEQDAFALIGKVRNEDVAAAGDSLLCAAAPPDAYVSCCLRVRELWPCVYAVPRGDATCDSVRAQLEAALRDAEDGDVRMSVVRRRKLGQRARDDGGADASMRPMLQVSFRSYAGIAAARKLFSAGIAADVLYTEWSPTERMLLELGAHGACWLRVTDASRCADDEAAAASSCKVMFDARACDVRMGDAADPPPPLVVASVHMRFEEHTVDARLPYRLRSFTCVVHRGGGDTPLSAAQFRALPPRDVSFHRYEARLVAGQACDDDNDDDDSSGNLDEFVASAYSPQHAFDTRTFDGTTAKGRRAYHAAIVALVERHDPDIVVNHGMLRSNLMRLVYELQVFGGSGSGAVHRSFFGRMRDANFRVRADEVQCRWPRRDLALAGRLVFDTQVLYDVYMKDDTAKQVRSDSVHELIEAYGVQSSAECFRPNRCAFAPGEQGAEWHRRFASSVVGGDDGDVAPVPMERNCYRQSPQLAGAVADAARNDVNTAYCQLELVYELQLVAFTMRITQLCGNLWADNLGEHTATRIEYLLMHEMRKHGYVVEQRGANVATAGTSAGDVSYTGGTVRQVVKGCYEGYSFLIDVESMYPSIIEHKRVCVAAAAATPGPPLVLPAIVRDLRCKRRRAATTGGGGDELKRTLATIEARALKLLSNQCYGCLGYTKFRFYNAKLASKITAYGREILAQLAACVDAHNECAEADAPRFNIIYGHTDSLLVNAPRGAHYAQCRRAFDALHARMNAALTSGVRVKLEAVYRTVVLYGANKYAGLRIVRPGAYVGQMRNLEAAPADLGQIYEIRVVGCEVVNRERAYFAQRTCMYLLHQVLMRGAHRLDAAAPDSSALRDDLLGVLGALRKATTNGAESAPSGVALARVLRMVRNTNVLNSALSTYKKPYGIAHLRAIQRYVEQPPARSPDVQRYTHRHARVEYAFVDDGGCSPVPVLCNEIARMPARVHWRYYVGVHLADLMRKTLGVFGDQLPVSLEVLLDAVGAAAATLSMPVATATTTTTTTSTTPRPSAERRDMRKMLSYSLHAQLAAAYAPELDRLHTQRRRRVAALSAEPPKPSLRRRMLSPELPFADDAVYSALAMGRARCAAAQLPAAAKCAPSGRCKSPALCTRAFFWHGGTAGGDDSGDNVSLCEVCTARCATPGAGELRVLEHAPRSAALCAPFIDACLYRAGGTTAAVGDAVRARHALYGAEPLGEPARPRAQLDKLEHCAAKGRALLYARDDVA